MKLRNRRRTMQVITLLSEDGQEAKVYNPYSLDFQISQEIDGKKYTFSKTSEESHLFKKADLYFGKMKYVDRLKVAQVKVIEEFNYAMRNGILQPPKNKTEDTAIKRKMYIEAAKIADKLKQHVVVYRY